MWTTAVTAIIGAATIAVMALSSSPARAEWDGFRGGQDGFRGDRHGEFEHRDFEHRNFEHRRFDQGRSFGYGDQDGYGYGPRRFAPPPAFYSPPPFYYAQPPRYYYDPGY